jgi:hypothetical protein
MNPYRELDELEMSALRRYPVSRVVCLCMILYLSAALPQDIAQDIIERLLNL